MVAKLGKEQFGIWALVSIIFGLFSVLDFGTGIAFVKYFSEYHTKKDMDSFNRTLMVGFVFVGIMMLLLNLGAFILKEQILNFFKIPSPLREVTTFVFLGSCIIFGIYKTFSIFTSIINGLQKMEITNSILAISSILHAVGVFLVLFLGLGLKGLLINQAVKYFIIITSSILFARKLIGTFDLRLKKFNLKDIKELVDYGFKIQLSNLANVVNLQTDKTLIGYFISLVSVSIYEIGQKISLFFQMIVGMLLSALVPAISELDAEGKSEKILLLYEKGNKYLFALTFPIALFIVFFSENIIKVWVGNGFNDSILVTQLLIIGVTVNMLTGIGTSIVRGIGEPIYETRYALISLVLNIALGLLLVHYYGFWGIILATPISVIIGSIYFIWSFHKIYNLSFKIFFQKVIFKPLIIAVILCISLYFINLMIVNKLIIESRIALLLLLIFNFILFFLFNFFLLYKINHWDEHDMNFITTNIYKFISAPKEFLKLGLNY